MTLRRMMRGPLNKRTNGVGNTEMGIIFSDTKSDQLIHGVLLRKRSYVLLS